MRRVLPSIFAWSIACSGAGTGIAEDPPGAETSEPPPSAPPAVTPDPPPPSAETPDASTVGTLRVMSYNIKVGLESDLPTIAGVIAHEEPDLVGLQEVDELTNRSGKVQQTKELVKLTKLPYGEFGASFAFDGGHYGLAILSKTPLTNPRVIRLDDHTERGNGYEPRIAFAADTVAKGRAFTFVTVHASLHAEERPGNAAVLKTKICDAGPAIIVGDMNETPSEAIGKVLTAAGYVDAHAEKTSNPFEGLTAPAIFPIKRIDFVYKHASFGKTKFSWVPSTMASDHRPVMVTFDTM